MRISLGNHSTESVSLPKQPIKMTEVQNLQEGDVFEGEILDIRHNLMLIKLNSNQQLLAKLLEQLEVHIGDRFLFQVKDKNEDHIIIKPFIEDTLTPKDQKVFQALEEAGLPINSKNIDLVSTLLREQQPITKLNIQKYHFLSLKFKDVAIEDLILFEKNEWPLEKPIIEQYIQYKQGSHTLLNSFENNGHSLTKIVEGLFDNGLTQEAFLLHNQIQKNTVEFFQSLHLSHNVKPIEFSLEEKQQLQMLLEKHQIPFKESMSFFEVIGKLPIEKQEKVLAELIEHKLYEPLIKNQMALEFFFDAKTFNKEQVHNYYKQLDTLVTKNIELLNTFTIEKSDGMGVEQQSIKHNIDFMKVLNQVFQYIQLPVRVKNQQVHTDLYVYKKNKKNNGKNISILLRLDMANLGLIDIYMDKQDTTIYSQLYIEEEETKRLFKKQLVNLVDQLKSKGFTFIPQVMDKKKEFDFVRDFIKEEDNNGEIKRFSFDIRV